MKPKDILTEELLTKEFIINKLSVHEIAKKYNINSSNSVSQAIKRFNLSRENKKIKFKDITREWLYQKYIVEDMSALDIAKLFGSKRKATILKLLHNLGIPIRQTTKTKKFKKYCLDKRMYGEMTSNYYNSLRMAAKKRNLEWSVSGIFLWELFLKQNKKCPYTGEILQMCNSTRFKSTQTASLDRIDSSKGYTEDNVQWVHKTVNQIKWNLSEKDFIKFCKKIANYRGEI